MGTLDPAKLADWTSGVWKNGVPEKIIGLANDTRSLAPGQLFAAFKTDARDGHDFLEVAREAGAAGAIVDRFRENVALPQLLVSEVGVALLKASKGYRDTWLAKVVGITGSCGKTTCKEVLSSLLSASITLSTPGNLNNLIGLPMSMLKAEASEAKFAVLEAGISEPGEMSRLAATIDPDFAIITSLGQAHLEGLGSIENIAREKGLLLHQPRLHRAFIGESCEPYLGEIGCKNAILVKQDKYLSREWAYYCDFSEGKSKFRQRIGGSVQYFEYNGRGKGLASNVALALATAFELGAELEELREGLASWRPAQMRNEWRSVEGCKVFVDCYNANPLSMRDSLATFQAAAAESEPRLYIIGCMEELGPQSAELHRQLGREIRVRNMDFLLVIGGEASSLLQGMKDAGCDMDRCEEIGKAEDATEHLAGFSGNVFLKGSRRYRLESVLESMKGEDAC